MKSDCDAASRAGAVLRLPVGRQRRDWPDVEIVFRGDCGFRRPRAPAQGEVVGDFRLKLDRLYTPEPDMAYPV